MGDLGVVLNPGTPPMRFEVYGPIVLKTNGRRLADDAKTAFGASCEDLATGLSSACGCYVFTLQPPRSSTPRPWYVGKAGRQTFEAECFTSHKLGIMNNVIDGYVRGRPEMFLYARVVASGSRFSKPSKVKHRDIDFLETMLIGLALDRNSNLSNIQQTDLLKRMVVPRLLNSGKGAPPAAAVRAAKMMGY